MLNVNTSVEEEEEREESTSHCFLGRVEALNFLGLFVEHVHIHNNFYKSEYPCESNRSFRAGNNSKQQQTAQNSNKASLTHKECPHLRCMDRGCSHNCFFE